MIGAKMESRWKGETDDFFRAPRNLTHTVSGPR